MIKLTLVGAVLDMYPAEATLKAYDAQGVLVASKLPDDQSHQAVPYWSFAKPAGFTSVADWKFEIHDEYDDGFLAGATGDVQFKITIDGADIFMNDPAISSGDVWDYMFTDSSHDFIQADVASDGVSWESIAIGVAAPAPTRTRLMGSRQINLELLYDGIEYETMEEASAASALLGSVTSPFIDLALMKVEVPESAYDFQDQPYAPANYGLVQAKVAFEAARASGAESDIQAGVDANQVASELADSTLTTNLAAEAARAVAAELVLTNDLAAEASRAAAAEAGIQADVDQNEADADAAMATEQAARIAGDAAVQANLTAYEASNDAAVGVERVRIDTLLSGSSVDFDTLLEITSAYQLVDSSVIASIVALQADVDQNESDSDSGLTSLSGSLTAETARALAAEGVIQADVNANQVVMDTEFASNLVDRAAIRSEFAAGDVLQYQAMIAAVAVAQADVDANEADGDTDRALIRTEMATASTARDASVEAIRVAIQADIDQNESDSDAADAVHTTNISAEIARATAAEGVNSAGLAQEILDRATGVLAESTSRQAADAAIQADVDQNELDGDNDRASIRTELAAGDAAERAFALAARNANETARDSGIAAAKAVADLALAAAKSVADAELAAVQTDVDQNELDGDNDRASIRTELAAGDAAERAFALAARNANETARDSGIAAAKAVADLALAAAKSVADAELAAEAAARIAADDALGSRIDDVLENVDPAALDSLTEIITEMQSISGSLSDSIISALGTHTSELAAHEAAYVAKMALLDAEDTAIRFDFAVADSAERAFALAARDANEAARDSSIAAAKVTADAALAAAKVTADAALAAEEAARIAADGVIQADVDANELSADTSFQAAGVDRALVRSEFAAADASALAASLLAASTEQALRIAAEAVIQADVDQNEADADAAMVTEIARAEAAELVLTNALAQEVVDRTADVDAEEARALAAEALMSSNSQADLASLQGRHYQVAFPALTVDGAIGVTYDMSAQAGWPLSSLSYLSLNGMILTSGADFDYVVDGNGNLTGWQMLIPTYVGDNMQLSGMSFITLIS